MYNNVSVTFCRPEITVQGQQHKTLFPNLMKDSNKWAMQPSTFVDSIGSIGAFSHMRTEKKRSLNTKVTTWGGDCSYHNNCETLGL